MIQASNLTLEEYCKLNGTLTSSMIEELLERYVNTDGYSAEQIQKPIGKAASRYPEDDFLDEAITRAFDVQDCPLQNMLSRIKKRVLKRKQEGLDALDEALGHVWLP
jgi:hypothetical protein